MAEKKVILAKSAGFCFGVHRAVDTVYERTDKKNVYTYGPIIHNEEVVKDLESKGVKAISDISDIDTGVDGNATVIIRSHGVSKSVYDSIRSKNYEIVDATCPFVLKIHRIVEEESAKGKQIIIIGNEKKRNEIFQMAMLEPTFAILDETDSGLDVDALRIVADGFNKLKTAETSAMVITHYQRLLDYIKPDTVHVLLGGRIVKTGGPELAKEIETRGFDWIRKEAGEL